jgi:Cys-tRNA(Pro)/Cys-tRNA(Cys) deacylase
LADTKTNAMRILDKAGISYTTHHYEGKNGFSDGISAAEKIGKPVEYVYKTLVCRGASKTYYVFVIPVAAELDLKAAARVVNEKSLEMVKVNEINKVTGYVRGGCSPIGMKRKYETVVDESCLLLENLIISAGKIGSSIELSPVDLIRITKGRLEKVILPVRS